MNTLRLENINLHAPYRVMQVKTAEGKMDGQMNFLAIISRLGELHLDIIIDRLKREFKVECNQGKPQVNYKEAITKTVMGYREVYKKQSGGRGKFADIIVNVGPVDEDYDIKENGPLQFINEVKGGNIPKEYIPAIQKGFEASLKNGILGGYPMDSLKVVVVDGSFHPVDSDQL